LAFFGHARHEAEGAVGIEHRVGGRPQAPDLEKVIHDPQAVETRFVGLAANAGQGRADLGLAARPLELVNLQTDSHYLVPP